MSFKSDLQNIADVFLHPRRATEYLRNSPTLLVPMVLVPLGAACAFLVSSAAFGIGESISAEAMESMAKQGEELPRNFGVLMERFVEAAGAIWFGIASYLSMFVVAAYLITITPDREVSIGFREWLSLTAWVQIPFVLEAVLNIIFAAWTAPEAGHPVALEKATNPFSLAYYLGADPSNFAVSFLGQINVFTIWMLALLARGYAHWTEKANWIAGLIVAAPYVLWWGGIATWSLLMAG